MGSISVKAVDCTTKKCILWAQPGFCKHVTGIWQDNLDTLGQTKHRSRKTAQSRKLLMINRGLHMEREHIASCQILH